jgi:3-hydroxyacyl-CoA dehydrogenase/enoyl-CoA hydratase/3-hydroxybutyryl-CoA epimerase
VRITRQDRDEVALLVLDHPDRSMNVVDEPLLDELRAHVRAIAADESVRAVVLASGKPGSFGAGADVGWLPQLAARPDAEEFLAGVHELMYEIVTSARPYVSAVNGPALGGALELVLATHAIVAGPAASFGLPEVTLGLIPGGAGTQLIRRWVDTATALDLLLSGRTLDVEAARTAGLVTRTVADDPELVDAAVALAREMAAEGPPWRKEPEPAATARAALAARAADAAASPAAAAIIDAVSAGIDGGAAAGCAVERQRFLALVDSPEARARIHLFVAEGNIKRRSRRAAARFAMVGLVGGGQMGSGIAATATIHGLRAHVRDLTDEKLAAARGYLDRVLARRPDARAASLWSGTTGWDGFDEADAVIEAVFELPDLKRETLRAIEQVARADALIATNTSAIPVHSLASALANPSRFLGMHFFSPVERMPLVELVPHAGTSPQTVERAAALARVLGKVPVVVADRPGFFTSRVYARWLIEGIRLLLDGTPAETIEAGAKAAGFPVGPLQACDEATLDLVVKASITQVAEKVMAQRLDVAGVRQALVTLIGAGIEGRRQGVGFYRYVEGKRAGVNPDVATILGVTPRATTEEEVRDRLLLAFATECFLCWDDGTLRSPAEGDVASVLGIGFPRALGGPFHWADETGLAEVRALCDKLGSEAFPPGARLTELARTGGRFADEPDRAG